MKNALNYFYGFYLEDIQKIYNNYYFLFNNNTYVVMPYERNLNEAKVLYELNVSMLNNGFLGYQIILTKDNSIIFYHDEQGYVVLKEPKIKNRIITYNDVLNFPCNTFNNESKAIIDKSNWGYIWEKKIDFYERQLKELAEKYPLLSESFFYYIGLFENAVSYYYDVSHYAQVKCVCHKRITVNMDLYSLYNPLTFVIDDKMRDIGEFLKSYVLYENYTKDKLAVLLNMVVFKREDVIMLISRILFPSYYFDLYEDVIVNELPEEEIKLIIEKQNNILYLLSFLFSKYSYYNIPQVDWIKKEGVYSPS